MTDPNFHPSISPFRCIAEFDDKIGMTHHCNREHGHNKDHECNCGRQWSRKAFKPARKIRRRAAQLPY